MVHLQYPPSVSVTVVRKLNNCTFTFELDYLGQAPKIVFRLHKREVSGMLAGNFSKLNVCSPMAHNGRPETVISPLALSTNASTILNEYHSYMEIYPQVWPENHPPDHFCKIVCERLLGKCRSETNISAVNYS